MSIGNAIDTFIKVMTNDPGFWLLGAFTVLGFLFTISLLCVFLWGLVKKIYCKIKGHSFYAEAVCYSCGRREFLEEQYRKETKNVV